jgi:hypothetical protein
VESLFNLWLVVGALAGHGVLDYFHHDLVHNIGVPPAWPGFCLTFDLTAAALFGCVLVFRARDGGIRPGPAATDSFRVLDFIGLRSAMRRGLSDAPPDSPPRACHSN